MLQKPGSMSPEIMPFNLSQHQWFRAKLRDNRTGAAAIMAQVAASRSTWRVIGPSRLIERNIVASYTKVIYRAVGNFRLPLLRLNLIKGIRWTESGLTHLAFTTR